VYFYFRINDHSNIIPHIEAIAVKDFNVTIDDPRHHDHPPNDTRIMDLALWVMANSLMVFTSVAKIIYFMRVYEAFG